MLFFYCINQSQAQAPTLTIGNTGICNTQTVLVPITGSNLANIGSLTLYISFDNQILSFDTLKNIDPQLNGLVFNSQTNPSRIALVWSNINGAHFTNNLLLNLKFNVLQQTGNISFESGCEIATVSLQIIPVNYISGSVYQAMPAITTEPANKTIKSQADAAFQVVSPNASEYAWQESRNNGNTWNSLADGTPYAGTHAPILTISHVPTNYNHNQYRCILKLDNCPATTNTAILSVDSVSGINDHSSAELITIYNRPNPFTETTTILYHVPAPGKVSIQLFNTLGSLVMNLVDNILTKGEYKIENNFVSLPTGIYFCRYIFTDAFNAFVNDFKLVKVNNN
ncbi:MAG: T9SS type A sorting domain-containing protein [Bacteroidota bacterium]